MTEAEFMQLTLPMCRRIYFSVRRVIGNDDASDVMQEILKRLWEHRESLGDSEQKQGYVNLTARSVIVHKLRDRSKYVNEAAVADFSDGMDDLLEHTDNLKIARNLLMELAPVCRQVMNLAAEGFSNQEIVEATGLSYDAVRAHLSRGRKKLKERYKAIHEYGKH